MFDAIDKISNMDSILLHFHRGLISAKVLMGEELETWRKKYDTNSINGQFIDVIKNCFDWATSAGGDAGTLTACGEFGKRHPVIRVRSGTIQFDVDNFALSKAALGPAYLFSLGCICFGVLFDSFLHANIEKIQITLSETNERDFVADKWIDWYLCTAAKYVTLAYNSDIDDDDFQDLFEIATSAYFYDKIDELVLWD